jgi:hypothetical protein
MKRRRVFSVGMVVFALVSAQACSMPGFLRVAQPKDGVTVKPLTANLAFGPEASPRDEQPGPASTVQAAAPTPAPTRPSIEPFAGFFHDDEPPRPAQEPVIRATEACPSGQDAVPEKPAGYAVEGAPLAGRYLWKQSGTIDLIGLTKFGVPSLATRRIRAVTEAPGVLRYEYEQSSIAGTEVQTVEIRQSGTLTDGVYLARLQFAGSGVSIDFNPSPLLAPKLMSLPVKEEDVSSTSVDPASALSFTLQGHVSAASRVRIEGCGEAADAWQFKGTTRLVQSITDANKAIRSTTYDWLFAPQLGGMFVGDRVVTQGNLGPFQYTSDVTSTLGHLRPVGS